MPNTTKSIKKLTNLPCCPYKGKGAALEQYPHCPSDLAIRCANDIIAEISQLKSVEEQEEKFSGIIAHHLNDLFLSSLHDEERVICFWSLTEKAQREEIQSGIMKTQAISRKSSKWALACINEAMSKVNSELHSIGFLTKLMYGNIGKSHIFDIKPDNKGFVLKAYQKISLEDSNGEFEYHFNYPNEITFKKLLDNVEKEIEGKRSTEAEEVAYQLIYDFCFSWKKEAKRLLNKIENVVISSEHQSIDEEAVIACAHFALIALFAVQNSFFHASYILAIAFRAGPHSSTEPHSSMVLFWPFNFQNSSNQHILFLLHLVLGLNSIETKKAKRELRYSEEVSEILAHDMKSFKRSILDIKMMVDEGWKKGELTVDDAREYFDTMVSSAQLFSQGIGIGLSVAMSSNRFKENRPISLVKLHENLYLSTRFHFCGVLFHNLDGWEQVGRHVDRSIMIVLSNLINNALQIGSAEIALGCEIEKKGCIIKVKSLETFNNAFIKEQLRKSISSKMPENSKGIWICRRVLELIDGELDLFEYESGFKTEFQVKIPWI